MSSTTAEVLTHGTASEQLHSSPQIGPRFATELLSINIFPKQPYEVNFRANQDVVTIAFGLCTGSKAYDSDRLTPLYETPGTAYYHPAGSEIYVLAAESSELLCLAFDPQLRTKILAELGGPQPEALTETMENINSHFLAAMTPVIRDYLVRTQFKYSIEGEALAVSLLENMLRLVLPGKPTMRRPGLDAPLLNRVLEYIETHLDEDLSLSTLSDVATVQLNHFVRAFKQASGTTPHQYILKRRLARAKELLRRRDRSLAQITYDLGFSSQAHFTTVFRKHEKVTPLQFRLHYR